MVKFEAIYKSGLLILGVFVIHSIVSAQSIKVEIKADSLVINSTIFTKTITLKEIESIIGKPDRVSERPFSTIWTYDELGVKIHFTPKTLMLDAIDLQYIRDDIDFFPTENFGGTFIVNDVQVSGNTSIREFEQIKGINFNYSFPTFYSAYTKDLKMVFVFTLDAPKLKSASISFE